MTRHEFKDLCNKITVILDGATGTELIKRGLPSGISPEKWVLENPQVIKDIHNNYREAGSNMVYAPTFGGNRKKLADNNLENELYEINYNLSKITKEEANNLVFGDMSPTGEFIEPFGITTFDEISEIYYEQAQALMAGGVDGFIIETMLDLQEARAAVMGVKKATKNLPIIVSMTFDENGRTLSGNTPESCLIALQALDVDAFGCNCSCGPQEMVKVIKKLKAISSIPLIAKPNAGLPQLIDGKTVFSMEPEAFGIEASKLELAGANLIGGCCGTTPNHIKHLKQNLKTPAIIQQNNKEYISSSRNFAEFSTSLTIGKLQISDENIADTFDLALELAEDDIIEISNINSVENMHELLMQLSQISNQFIMFNLENGDALEEGVKLFCGRAIVKNNNPECETIALKYGSFLL